MALEERVKALEDEVSILKDQIHQTLLEIQEQVLIHYYPQLRAREASPPEAALSALRGNGAAQAGRTFSGLERVVIEPEPGQTQGESVAALNAPALPGPQPALPAAAPGQDEDWATVMRLSQWASHSVETIGKERTAQAVEMCARGGYLDARVHQTLQGLIALSDEEGPQRVSLRAVHEALLRLNEILGQGATVASRQLLAEGAGDG